MTTRILEALDLDVMRGVVVVDPLKGCFQLALQFLDDVVLLREVDLNGSHDINHLTTVDSVANLARILGSIETLVESDQTLDFLDGNDIRVDCDVLNSNRTLQIDQDLVLHVQFDEKSAHVNVGVLDFLRIELRDGGTNLSDLTCEILLDLERLAKRHS